MFAKSTSNEIINNVPSIGVLLSQISIFILISIISCKVWASCNVTKYWRLWPEFLKLDPPDPKSWIRYCLAATVLEKLSLEPFAPGKQRRRVLDTPVHRPVERHNPTLGY